MKKINVTLELFTTGSCVEDILEVAEDVQDYEIEELIVEWAADQIAVTYEEVG